MREYPAYGRTIAAHIVRGQKPICVAVLLSSRWRYFDHVPKLCIKPEDWETGRYEFGYLNGLHVVVVPGDECEELQLAELLVDVMCAGPRELWAWNTDGSKIYDDDWAHGIADWVREIRMRAKMNWRDGWPEVQRAEAAMSRAQLKDIDLFQIEGNRIQEKSGLDAFVRWSSWREFGVKDRVRELFANPWQAPVDARTA